MRSLLKLFGVTILMILTSLISAQTDVEYPDNLQFKNGDFDKIFLKKSWQSTANAGHGDYLYFGVTGNRSNTLQHALILTEKNGVLFGKGSEDGTSLSAEYAKINTYGLEVKGNSTGSATGYSRIRNIDPNSPSYGSLVSQSGNTQLGLFRDLSINSVPFPALGAELSSSGSLKLRRYGGFGSFISADDTPITSDGGAYDMITLEGYNYSSFPTLRHTWFVGLMGLVELDGVAWRVGDDYDCYNCLTYSFKLNTGDTYIKRIIDDDGEDYYVSDERLKKNITAVDNGMDIISRLSPKKYKFKSGGANARSHYGLLAQEVQKVVPELIRKIKQPESGEESLLMNYDGLVPILIKSVQEQQALIESLQKRISEIESK